MGYVTTDDGVRIFYKDWGSSDAQPIVFHHGWPLSSDDWDAQMLFFLSKGYRVVAHDRRGHGRSEQVADGHDMDHYAADAFAIAKAHYDGIKAFSETDQTGDLEAIAAPTLVLHGEDDQVFPIAASALKAVKLLPDGKLKTYPGLSHGMLTVNADVLNADLLAFVTR